MTEEGRASNRSRRWRSVGRIALRSITFASGLAVATATLLVVGWLTFVSVPAVHVTLRQTASGGWVVIDAPVAEYAWVAGVRPGMTVGGFVAPGPEPGGNWDTLAVTDGVVTIGIPHHPMPPDPGPVFAGTIALLLAAFAYRLAPTPAWWLLAVPPLVALAVASDLVPAPIAFILATAPPGVAATCAAERVRGILRAIPAAGVLVVGGGWLLAHALRFETWVVPRQLSAITTVALLGLATAGVVRDAGWRAHVRLRRHGANRSSRAVFLTAIADELVPGRARSRLLAIERERAALATDLHADVLPELAAVIRSMDSDVDDAERVSRLRGIARDLRELMGERRLAVLDALGLVPALELLAERVQSRTNVEVEIDVHGPGAGRAPREVELAAYRIVQQALDNALVHARPSRIRFEVEIADGRVQLAVTDDGIGLPEDAEARALRAGRLGLADMRSRATAIGAAFRIWRRAEGGTTVELRWPA